MTTSFHINGFWYHLNHIHSTVYRDQHNNLWILKNGRFHYEFGGLVSEPIQEKLKGWTSVKDMFLQEREAWASYFHNRTYANL